MPIKISSLRFRAYAPQRAPLHTQQHCQRRSEVFSAFFFLLYFIAFIFVLVVVVAGHRKICCCSAAFAVAVISVIDELSVPPGKHTLPYIHTYILVYMVHTSLPVRQLASSCLRLAVLVPLV